MAKPKQATKDTGSDASAQLAAARERLREHDERIRALLEEEKDLNKKVAEGLAAGVEAKQLDGLRDRRRHVRHEVEDLGAARPLVVAHVAKLEGAVLEAERRSRAAALGTKADAIVEESEALDSLLDDIEPRVAGLRERLAEFRRLADGLDISVTDRFARAEFLRDRLSRTLHRLWPRDFPRPRYEAPLAELHGREVARFREAAARWAEFESAPEPAEHEEVLA